jgi:hypothetical protein
MNEYWITLAGQSIRAFDAIDPQNVRTTTLTLPCMEGEDVTRSTGRISVMWSLQYGIVDAGTGRNINVEDGETLMGWGELDGESVVLKPDECAWSVDVNAELWAAANRWADFHLAAVAA